MSLPLFLVLIRPHLDTASSCRFSVPRKALTCWSKSTGGPPGSLGGWRTCYLKRDWENWVSSSVRSEGEVLLLSTTEDGTGFFSQLYRGRMRRNGHKMRHSKFQDDIRKRFFTVWLFRYWNGPRGGHSISILGDTQNLGSQVADLI